MRVKSSANGSITESSGRAPELPTISDAAEYAIELMRRGDIPAYANCRAAEMYHCDVTSVAEETGTYASAVRARKKWFKEHKKRK